MFDVKKEKERKQGLKCTVSIQAFNENFLKFDKILKGVKIEVIFRKKTVQRRFRVKLGIM